MLFIINAKSGIGKKRGIAQMLRSKGYNVVFTEYAGHAETLARECDDEVVVAVGGDGTVNEVARGIIGSEKTLGIIPCGSGNGLARHLGISLIPAIALKTIEKGNIERIDAAEVNGRLFLSVCGVGFDAEVSERFAQGRQRGVFNYIRYGLNILNNYPAGRYTIEIDGEKIETEAILITVGNSNQWGNGAMITPLAECNDGVLDVTVVERFSSLETPWLACRLMTGSLHKSHRVHCYKGKEIRIIREEAGAAHTDGDLFTTGRTLNIKTLPSALKVIV